MLSLCLSIILANTAVASLPKEFGDVQSVATKKALPGYPIGWHDSIPYWLNPSSDRPDSTHRVEICPQKVRRDHHARSHICKIVFEADNDGNRKIEVWEDCSFFDEEVKNALAGSSISLTWACGEVKCRGRVCIYTSNTGYESQFMSAVTDFIDEPPVVKYINKLLKVY